MIRDKKLIAEYKQKYGVTPLVFSWEREIYTSEHKKRGNNPVDGVYDFSLKIPNVCQIEVKDVHSFQFFFPPKRRENGYPCYTYADEERIIEPSDCKDCVLILYKKNRFNHDILIYHNFEKYLLLREVSFYARPYDFDYKFFVYRNRKGEKCYAYDGKTYTQADLMCSLADWCRAYKREKLLEMYSKENSITLEDLSWNYGHMVLWECAQNHKFKATPHQLTLSDESIDNLCPICKKRNVAQREKEYNDRAVVRKKFLESVLKKYNLKTYAATYKAVRKQLIETMEYARNNPAWRTRTPDWPKKMKGLFTFPNGKQGDINMFIATEYGVARQVDGLIWELELPTDNLDIIEYLCEYGIEINEFITMANTRFAVAPLLKEMMALYDVVDSSVSKDHFIVNRQGTDIIREYRESIRPKRNKIYEEVIKQGKAGGKWKSEQQAYALVSSIYPDAIYQHHEDWLDLQSLDIFIPSLSIAIEYQGVQHFSSVDIFGGEEGLKDRKERDAKKRRLCELHGIDLIDWNYNEPLTKDFIFGKITQILNGRKG